jgi:hypothetical protein
VNHQQPPGGNPVVAAQPGHRAARQAYAAGSTSAIEQTVTRPAWITRS